MKKKFTFLMAAVMLLMMIGLPWKVVGQTRGTLDVINNSATSSYTGSTSTTSWVTNFSITGTSGATYYIHTMGTKGTSNALQFNSNGYLYMTGTNTNGEKLKSITIRGTSGKRVYIYTSNSAYNSAPSGAGTNINLNGNDVTYTFNSDVTYLAIKGRDASTQIVSITIEWKTPPSCSISPTSWNFGHVEVGEESSKTFSVTHANLSSALSLSVGTGYSISPTSIAANASSPVNVTVTCSPTIVGEQNGTLTISGGGLASNVTASLSATGDCSDPANALAYDDVSLPLVNGEAETTLEPKTGTGNGGTAFTYEITNGNEEHAMVDNDGTFWADAAGTWEVTATQALNGTTCGGSATINIVVTSSPICTISPTSYAFGNVLTSSENECIFTVNTANLTHALTVSVEPTATGFSVTPPSIAANASSPTQVTVTYTAPSSAGSQVSATLRISGDDFDDDITATITATPTAGYTITFHGGSGTPAILSVTNLSGHVFQLPSATPSAMCSDAGWTFTGWNVNDPISTTDTEPAGLLTAGSNYTISGDAELYAVYSVIEGGASNSGNVFESGSYNNGSITWTLAGVVTILQEQYDGQTAPNSSYVASPRWYSGNKITITPSQTINSITVTATTEGYATALANSTYNNATAAANGTVVTITPTNGNNEITIVMGGQSRLSSLTVNYGSGTTTYATSPNCTPQVATPTFSPVAGFYSTTQNVTIHCETATPRTIYYTTDGSTPTTNSSVYSSAISVSETTTIKAFAVKTNYENSEVAETTFVINNADHPYTVAQARAAIDANFALSDVYVYGIVSTAGTVSNGAITYYISDDGTTTTQLQAYRGKSFNGEDFVSNDDIQVGDKVIIRGTLKKFGTTYEFDAGNTLISLERDPIITVSAESISGLSCIVGTGVAPYQAAAGEAMTFTVGGANLKSNITLTLSSGTDFEMKSGNGSWQTTPITLTEDGGNVATTTISVRMKANATTIGEKTATIAIESTNAPSKNVALTGNVNYATLAYNANGGTGDAPTGGSSYHYNQPITVADKGSLTKEHHSFNGWNTKEDGEGVSYAVGSTLNIIANTTLYAQWAINSHSVTMPAEDDYGTYTASPSNPVGYNAEVTLTFTPNSGYENFATAWRVNGGSIDGNTFNMPDEDVTVTINLIPKYQVTYDDNNATSGTAPSDETLYVSGTDVTVLGNSGKLTKTEKFWNGWNTKDDGTGTHYDAGSTFEITANTKLYAEWRNPYQYALVTKDNPVEPGKHYIIASSGSNGSAYAMGAQKSNNRYAVEVTISSGTITEPTTGGSSNTLYEFALGGPEVISNTSYYTFYDKNEAGLNETTLKIGYLQAPSSNNHLRLLSTLGDNGRWTIAINESNNIATITSKASHAYKYMRYNSSSTLFSCYQSGTQSDVYLYKRIGDSHLEIYSPTTIGSNTSVTDLNITSTAGNALTVSNNAILTVTGKLSNTNPANLVIEDGGQLILANGNTGVQATVRKTTAESSEKVISAWNAISSSVDNVAISSFIQDESGDQDKHNVYRYDEATVVWQEYRNTSNAFSNLTNGRGYLYRSLISGVEFSGDVNTGNIDCTDFLSWSCDEYGGRYKGFNLIGNPFTHDITWSNITNKENISGDGYYTLKSDGTWNTQTTGGTIAPMQAFLIQATGASPKLKIANTVGKGDDDKFGGDQIMFNVENSEYSDVAYVLFKKGHGLNKIEHCNDKTPMLYIINEDGDYAIADMPDNTSVINLGFEAKTMGQYTFSLKAEGRYSYMHLIDKLTGEDVDMLIEDSYTFMGSPRDRKDRFVLRLNYNAAGIDTESSIFAYQSGNEIIVSGEGELQIFDVMGRLVMNQRINGVQTINGINNGVYIFKLEGKTQKIVVR